MKGAPGSIDGKRLRAARLRKDWTQLDLALRAGVTQDLISKLERGTKPHVWLSTAVAIARALGCPIETLLVRRPRARRQSR